MNNDLISREALKEAINEIWWVNKFDFDKIVELIDNAPTVPLPDFKEGYKQAILDGKTNFSRPQGEYTEEDIKQTIKENFELGYEMAKHKYERPQGEWVRKEDVIHSIAKQYSEHNELVPIWLSIGDMKGGAEE